MPGFGYELVRAEETTGWTVSFNDGYSEENGGFIVSVNVPSENETTLAGIENVPESPVRQGYRFLGWFESDEAQEAWNISENAVKCNMILTAKWVEQVTVEFDVAGGTLNDSSLLKQTVDKGAKLQDPGNPTKTDGSTFAGWFKEGASASWNFESDTADANMKLTASWNKVETPATEYTVTLSANGDNVTGMPSESEITVTENGTLGDKLPTPSKDGYTFAGWREGLLMEQNEKPIRQ